MRALIAPYELCAALSRSVRWTAGLSIAWRAIDETIFNYRVLKTITAYAMDTTIGKTTLDAETILPSREKTLPRSSDPDGYRLKNHRYTNLLMPEVTPLTSAVVRNAPGNALAMKGARLCRVAGYQRMETAE